MDNTLQHLVIISKTKLKDKFMKLLTENNGKGVITIYGKGSVSSNVLAQSFGLDSDTTRLILQCLITTESAKNVLQILIDKFNFNNEIKLIDIIEENNTAYAVTEHIESLSLREFLLRSKTGYLNWEKAKVLFMPVLSLLSNLHQSGIVHYGISPDTLLIGRDGKLRLSGFSIPEARFERTQIPAELFDGYTPPDTPRTTENRCDRRRSPLRRSHLSPWVFRELSQSVL